VSLVRDLVQRFSCSVNHVSDAGTAMHYAVADGNAEVVKDLLSLQADPSAVDRNNVPLVVVATATGNAEMVRLLLESGADIVAQAPGGVSALTVCADMGNMDILDAILESADATAVSNAADVRNSDNLLPVEVAAWAPHLAATEKLLSITPSLSETCQQLLARIAFQRKQASLKAAGASPVVADESQCSSPAAQDAVAANNAKNAGNKCFKARQFKEAVACYTEGLEHMPMHAQLLNNRANAHLRLGLAELALQDSSKACEASPTWHKAFYQKGNCLMTLKRYTDAAETFWKGYELVKSKAMLMAFNKAVAFGKREHQGKVGKVKGQEEPEPEESDEEVETSQNATSPETQKYDHVISVEVPRSHAAPDKLVTLPLAYNNDETPVVAAGRFVDKFNLDPSLIPRIANYVHTRRQSAAEEED